MASGRFPLSVLGIGLAGGLAAAVAGCSVEMMADMPLLGGGTQTAEDMVAEDMVMIGFRNLAISEAVDVEFYATNEPLENLPDDLFVAENLVTANLGVAGTGIVEPWRQDVIEFPCTSSLTVGTRGGNFMDSESGEPRGTGSARWAQEGPVGLCGSIVTFEFSGSDGDFTTTLKIGG